MATRESPGSDIPRIAFADLPPALATAIAPRVERLGYLGEFFQCGAHQPDALAAFHLFTEASKAACGADIAEVAALTASLVLGNDYERHQHERLCISLGMTSDWVAAVEMLAPEDAALLSEQERLAQKAALALLKDHGHGAKDDVAAYVTAYGAPAAVALLFILGRYTAHSLVANALEFEPPVPSIFDSVAS